MDATTVNEKQTLRAILGEPKLIYDLDKNYFVSEPGRVIFEALRSLTDEGRALTKEHVFAEANRLSSSITEPTVAAVVGTEYVASEWEQYKLRLKKDYVRAQVSGQLLQDTLVTTNAKGDLDVAELERNIEKIRETVSILTHEKATMMNASELMGKLEEDMYLRERGLSFYKTGDSHLDSALRYGFAPGMITTLFAVSGAGKTTAKLMLINKRINLRMPTISFELEMGSIPVSERLIAMRNMIPANRLMPDQDGQIDESVYQIIQEDRERLKKFDKFRMIEDDELSIADVENYIVRAKEQMGVDYMTVFIDLATMLTDFNTGYGSAAERYEKALNKLHALSRRQNVHLFLIVQANRSVEDMKVTNPEDVEKISIRPTMVKNSEAFRERSRVLIGLHRMKYFLETYFPESPENAVTENVMEWRILKQNGGELGVIRYLFQPQYYTLTKYEGTPVTAFNIATGEAETGRAESVKEHLERAESTAS